MKDISYLRIIPFLVFVFLLLINTVNSGVISKYQFSDSTESVEFEDTMRGESSSSPPSTATRSYVISSDTVLMIIIIVVIFAYIYRRHAKKQKDTLERIAVDLYPGPSQSSLNAKQTQTTDSIDRSHVKRPSIQIIPTPYQALTSLADYAKRSKTISNVPHFPSWSWSMGVATDKGNVRAENQDFVLGCRIDELDVICLADGMGGLSHGQRASYLAVLEAMKSIVADLGPMFSLRSAFLNKVIRKALTQAHHSLSIHGDKLAVDGINGGLRTTLIIVISDGDDVSYGYIGDGGLDILHTNGHLESIMNPQKDELSPNVLTASLGPEKQGDFVIGEFSRKPGDLIIVSTDGIADRVDTPAFARDVMKAAINANGDLSLISKEIVSELANMQDGHGYICDDNLTLAVLGTGSAPKLCNGFWDKQTVENQEIEIYSNLNHNIDISEDAV